MSFTLTHAPDTNEILISMAVSVRSAVRASWLLVCLLSDSAVAMRILSSSRRRFVVVGAAAVATQQGKAVAAEQSLRAPGSLGARVEELKTLGARVEQNGKAEVPEFWAGRLQGKPPPTPKVVLRGDVPPFVILPGFGNDQVDYVTPNGLPEEVGLVAALERRGISAVSVVPIQRTDWLNVARGLTDLGFVAGNAQPEGPAFSWYVAKAKATVERAVAAREKSAEASSDARVVLVGHSAGGWLARALCAVAGDEWVRQNIRGVVTLGAPHTSPPPEVADQTRGTIPAVNKRAPGAVRCAERPRTRTWKCPATQSIRCQILLQSARPLESWGRCLTPLLWPFVSRIRSIMRARASFT
jgi:pimeloyl-ACP methyl ester carboxylesterase